VVFPAAVYEHPPAFLFKPEPDGERILVGHDLSIGYRANRFDFHFATCQLLPHT
jgi:hypothetical protein